MGSRDHFVLLHQGEQATTRLTAHSFTNVDEVISSIELQNSGPQSINSRFTGDTSVWSFLPKAYIVRAAYAPLLLFVNGVRAATQTQSLPWYAEAYDVMYQGVLGVTEMPGSEYLLIAIQRDSKPLVYSPASRTIVKKLELAERHGNPQLYFRHGASELWASDYDTLVKLEAVGWRVLGSLHLQKGHSGMVSMNIGRFCFNADETLCAVARPHSGDVGGLTQPVLRSHIGLRLAPNQRTSRCFATTILSRGTGRQANCFGGNSRRVVIWARRHAHDFTPQST